MNEITKTKLKKVLKCVGKVFSFIGCTLLALIIALYGTGIVITHGPSEKARDLFVQTMLETSAAKWVPSLFLSANTIKNIKGGEKEEPEEQIDTNLIVIPTPDNSQEGLVGDYEGGGGFKPTVPEDLLPAESIVVNENGIKIVEISGSTYQGEMMIIDDPSRVFVATLDSYGPESHGLTLSTFISKYDAIAGVNAGGFYDPDGTGNGGIPDGLVMGGGKILWGGTDLKYNCVIGFDENYIMHVGSFSGKDALDLNIVSAVSFAPGPVLVVNGKPLNENKQLGGGLNPRTAIGQRADGAILLLVVDGRQVESLGATYDDLVDIMLEFGAVNAANLDGGSSTRMHYNGMHINDCASLIGERGLPNAILVKKEGALNG